MSTFKLIIIVLYCILYAFSKSKELGLTAIAIVTIIYVTGLLINVINAKRRKAGKPHLFSKKLRKQVISDDSELIQDMKANKRRVYEEKEQIIEKKEELSAEIISEYKKELDSKEYAIVNEVKKIDENFNAILFLKLAHDIGKELIKTKIVKYSSAQYLYQALNKNVVEIKYPDFYSFESDGKYYVLKMKIDKKVVEHLLDNYGYDIIEIDREKSSLTTFEMTFVKSLKEDGKTRNCPRCGAPLTMGAYGICKYCFKFIDSEGAENIESNVTQISYDVPVIKLEEIIPHSCLNCGAPLNKDLKGYCEYCKSDNNPADNKWVLVEFKNVNDKEVAYILMEG